MSLREVCLPQCLYKCDEAYSETEWLHSEKKKKFTETEKRGFNDDSGVSCALLFRMGRDGRLVVVDAWSRTIRKVGMYGGPNGISVFAEKLHAANFVESYFCRRWKLKLHVACIEAVVTLFSDLSHAFDLSYHTAWILHVHHGVTTGVTFASDVQKTVTSPSWP